MFCREVGTTIIRGIFDKNKAETPSKKRFLGGGTGRGQDARAASVHWGGVYYIRHVFLLTVKVFQ